MEKKIERKRMEIQARAERKIKEQKEEEEKRIQQFLRELQDIKHDYEINKLIEKQGYPFDETLMKDERVRNALLKRLIDDYPINEHMSYETKSNIVGICYAVFETIFNSIPYRLGMEKDENITKKACEMLLNRANGRDIDLSIVLKYYLKIDNSSDVRKKLDFMEGLNIDDKDFVHNSVNAIYFYEQLLKWVINQEQRREIIDKIVAISKTRINNNITAIANAEKKIRQLKKEKKNARREIEYQIGIITEKNTPKIEKLQNAIEEQEKLLSPLAKKREQLLDRLTKLGYFTMSYDARESLKKGRVREAHREIKDRDKVRKMMELLKEDRQIDKKERKIEKHIRELEKELQNLKFEIYNVKKNGEITIEKINIDIENNTRQIYYSSKRILDSLIKIGDYEQFGQIDKKDYYKYLEIALDNSDRESDIKQIEKALKVIKEVDEC